MPSHDHDDLLDALSAIPVESLTYQEWCDCGMALHKCGFALRDWQAWSATDTRRRTDGKPYYSEHETASKWAGFDASREDAVGSGTIIHMAEGHGWKPASRSVYGWDDWVQVQDSPNIKPITTSTIDSRDVGEESVETGKPADPTDEFLRWLRALFRHDERIGIVTRTKDGKPSSQGRCDMTREQIEDLLAGGAALTDAFGEANPANGAFVCINPLDGEGRHDANVTAYRYALVESDKIPPGKQLAMVHEMKLPCAAITYSGGKSVHAIVHIDAASKKQYRERVSALYEYCRKSGFEPDEQNKNPSRLTRCPGFQRGENWQRLIESDASEYQSWDEWQDWVVQEAAQLPDIESFGSMRELPELAPELIEGVLRRKQKMLVVGPSKAGKSFLMIELAIAVAERWEWLGHQCAKGRVLIVNLEIQRPSMLHRIEDVYRAMEATHEGGRKHPDNLDVWNLRGYAAPLDKLEPMLERGAASRNYDLIIIDPIYKILTGDENSASDMALFCNQFDLIAEHMGCNVVYCHHHAKGEAGRRVSMDRASGSGVFVRDPDAFLDMSPIRVTDQFRDVIKYFEGDPDFGVMYEAGAYRVSYTLREFRTLPPTDVLFKWPLHEVTHELGGCVVVGEPDPKGQTGAASQTKQQTAKREWALKNLLISLAWNDLCRSGARRTCETVAGWLAECYPREAELVGIDAKRLGDWTAPSAARGAGTRKPNGCEWVKEVDPTNPNGPRILVPLQGG